MSEYNLYIVEDGLLDSFGAIDDRRITIVAAYSAADIAVQLPEEENVYQRNVRVPVTEEEIKAAESYVSFRKQRMIDSGRHAGQLLENKD